MNAILTCRRRGQAGRLPRPGRGDLPRAAAGRKHESLPREDERQLSHLGADPRGVQDVPDGV